MVELYRSERAPEAAGDPRSRGEKGKFKASGPQVPLSLHRIKAGRCGHSVASEPPPSYSPISRMTRAWLRGRLSVEVDAIGWPSSTAYPWLTPGRSRG